MGLLDRVRSRKRVAVIGIDGVPYGLVERGTEEGWMENLLAMRSSDRMRAALPVVSSVCWPCATTGLNPGGTGVYGFQERTDDGDGLHVPLSTDVHGERLWDAAGREGRSSLVLNVPVTFPPGETRGTLVSGFLSPDVDSACTSSATAERLKKLDYRVDADVSLHGERDRFMKNIHETLDARLRAFKNLIGDGGWHLFFGVVMETDRLNHFYWRDYAEEGEYLEDFLDVYRKVDSFIGEVESLLPEDTELVVMSDHGFTSVEREVDVNAWLESEGFLENRSREEDNSLRGVSGSAYSLTPGRVYVDLKSRRPGGSVDGEDYLDVRSDLAEFIEGLEDPETGESVIDSVHTREELYEGPRVESGPDLVAHPVDGYDLKASFGEGPLTSEGPRTGMHTLDDASLLSTAELDGGAEVWDVFPTVMELLGLRPGDVYGTSLVRQV
ncbi:MAG: hypothetical protein MAG715_00120 [Methanonatronarchaeales archaeon]|nr:hypothetical protein [Methanonatronarchaeales archaeon]